MPWTRRDWIYLLLLTALAATLRLYKLGEIPPGFQFDEAFNAIDAEQVWHGNRPLFLPANGGREALYTYFQVAIGTFLGFTIYSLRLTSAIAGILTIPATYWLVRTLLQHQSRNVAFFTSLTLTISFWHLHFSHYGIRVILMPLLLCGIMGSFWLTLHSPKPGVRWIALVAAGTFTGLAPWTHPAGRFVPFILVGYVGWLLWSGWRTRGARHMAPHRTIDLLRTLLLTGLLAFLIFLPLGIEFYRHPEFFFGHASEVSIFAERVRGDTPPWRLLVDNLLLVLGMFNIHGDIELIHNMPGRPVFEWPLGLAFLIGIGLWIGRLVRRADDDPDVDGLVLLAGWSLVMLLPSVLSDAAPNFSRTLPSLPAIFVAVGLGLSWLADTLPRRLSIPRQTQWTGYALAGILVTISALWATYDYFVRFPQLPENYYLYDVDKLDALAALEELAAADNAVYLSPLWSEHATFVFLRDSSIIKSLDSGDTIVLPPPGEGAVYAFPSEKLDRAADLAREWEGIDAELLQDPYGRPLLALVKVPADQLIDWPERYVPTSPADDVATDVPAHFDDAPTLLGLQQRNDNRELRLFWRAEAPTYRSLTAFLHFIDRSGRRVAQVDKLPGNGTYLTPTWTPGERVIERYHANLHEICANGNELTLLVGWYELAADGARRSRLNAGGSPAGDSAVAGTVTFPITAHPPTELSLPADSNILVADDLILYGYSINRERFTPGASFSIDLFWWASDALNRKPVTLQLRRGEIVHQLWQEIIAPNVSWHAGEMICRRVHVTLPTAMVPGDATLELTTVDSDTLVIISTIDIHPR